MWIRMISTAAGPRLPHALLSEKTYQVDDELGAELVALRAAEEVADPNPPRAKAPEVEVAAVDDGEKALADGAEKKPESLIEKLRPDREAVNLKKSSANAAKK